MIPSSRLFLHDRSWHTPAVVRAVRLLPVIIAFGSLVYGFSALSGLAPAHAQDADSEASEDEAVAFTEPDPTSLVTLPGRCEHSSDAPHPHLPGVGFDCTVPLATNVSVDDIYDAVIVDPFSDVNEFGETRDTQCVVQPSEEVLRCDDVGADVFAEGGRTLLLRVNSQTVGPVATVRTSWGSGPVSIQVNRDQVAFPGRPLRVGGFADAERRDLHLLIAERGSGEEVLRRVFDRVSWDEFGGFTGTVDPGAPTIALEPGLYRSWLCVGPSPSDCDVMPGGIGFEVIDPTLLELVAGHNRPTAERINVVFVGVGLGRDDATGAEWPDGLDSLPAIAREMLALDGPISLEWDGSLTDPDAAEDRPGNSRYVWGPFAVEPLLGNEHLFNFWYLEQPLRTEAGLLSGAADDGHHVGWDLPNVQVTALYSRMGEFASDARFTSFFDRRVVPPATRLVFGDARLAIDAFDPLSAAPTLTHEWGHGLFALRDEYYGFDGRPVSTAVPNCAPDEASAREWWDGLIGAVDPMVWTLRRQLGELELDQTYFGADLADAVRIEPTIGGCYGNFGEATAIRPNRDSLMNSEIPIFGSVNRRQVEAVLARFSGRAVLSDLADVAVSCTSEDGQTRCNGTLPTSIDPPVAPLLAGDGRCWFGAERDPARFACLTDEAMGEDITLTLLGAERSVSVRVIAPAADDEQILEEPPTSEPADDDDIKDDDINDDDASEEDSNDWWWSIFPAIGAVVASALWLRRRRNQIRQQPSPGDNESDI